MRILTLSILAFACTCAVPDGVYSQLMPEAMAVPLDLGTALPASCSLDRPPSGARGQRRLALLVGVGDPQAPGVDQLPGTRADIAAMQNLLVQGYGFHPDDVCVLENHDATTAAVIAALRGALIDRAEAGDTAVFYFSGHGLRVLDGNHDEPDGLDEVLLTHDGGVGEAPGLRDDVLNSLMAELSKRTRNVTVILDACTSGSAMKSANTLVKAAPAFDRPFSDEPSAPTEAGWAPASMDGLVMLSAARDGTPAGMPGDGGPSYFTSALITALSEAKSQAATWKVIARRVEPLLAARSRIQAPLFQGAVEREVFELTEVGSPLGWEVTHVSGAELELAGVPLPGSGPGAVVAIYRAGTSRAQAADPGARLAMAEIVQANGLRMSARVDGEVRAAPQRGDLAVLVLPSSVDQQLRVMLDASLSEVTAGALRGAIGRDEEATRSLRVDDVAGDLRVRQGSDGALEIVNDGGVVLLSLAQKYNQELEVVAALLRFARQRAMLQLAGESASWMNDQALEVRLLPYRGEGGPAKAANRWYQARPNQTQIVPLCGQYQIEVTNRSEDLLRVGALILSSNGDIYGRPLDGVVIDIPPGGTKLLGDDVPWVGLPPTELEEHLIVIGTSPELNIPWHLLTEEGVKGGGCSSLERLLREVLRPTKGPLPLVDESWTTSHLSFVVTSNPELMSLREDLDLETRWEGEEIPVDLEPYLAVANPELRALTDGLRDVRRGPACAALKALLADPVGRTTCAANDVKVGDVLRYTSPDVDSRVLERTELVIDPRTGLVWGDLADGGVGFRLSRGREVSSWYGLVECSRSAIPASQQRPPALPGDVKACLPPERGAR